MKRMLLAANCLVMMAVGTTLLSTVQSAPAAVQPQQAAADKTEDILYLLDGRILHGKILDETYATYLFQYVDKRLALTTEMSVPKSEVVKIDRDVAVADSGADASDADAANDAMDTSSKSAAAEYSAEKMKEKYGATLATDAEGVPTFYVVPMRGQMGTDILTDIYKEVAEDIRRVNPDMVVFVMECNETSTKNSFQLGPWEQQSKDSSEWGLLEMDDYKELVQLLRTQTGDIPQVMWIRDSEGISSLVALAWDEIYMFPDARLGGLIALLQRTGANLWPDVNVRAKMVAAMMSIGRAFLEMGGHDQDLAVAMLDPTHSLSGDWNGRTINWELNSSGEVVVDSSDKHTTDFVAKSAEDYGLSHGTAQSLDDLAILLGYREYRLLDGTGEEIIDDYIKLWRRGFAGAERHLETYSSNRNAGDIVGLGKARKAIQAIKSLVQRHVAIERRMKYDYGLDIVTLTVLEEQLDELIAIASQNRGRRGGGNSGGGGRLGNGGGGGGIIDD